MVVMSAYYARAYAVPDADGVLFTRSTPGINVTATCSSSFAWMNNGKNQSPCEVAARVQEACATTSESSALLQTLDWHSPCHLAWPIPALQSGNWYNAPDTTTATDCTWWIIKLSWLNFFKDLCLALTPGFAFVQFVGSIQLGIGLHGVPKQCPSPIVRNLLASLQSWSWIYEDISWGSWQTNCSTYESSTTWVPILDVSRSLLTFIPRIATFRLIRISH